MKPYIGIDLGTTNTVVACADYIEDGNVKIDILDIEQISDRCGSITVKKNVAVLHLCG